MDGVKRMNRSHIHIMVSIHFFSTQKKNYLFLLIVESQRFTKWKKKFIWNTDVCVRWYLILVTPSQSISDHNNNFNHNKYVHKIRKITLI